MTAALLCPAVIVLFTTFFGTGSAFGRNLTCYQCERNTVAECKPEELLPCSSTADRCVTHITKSAERGFTIKRECGLGPCGFNDDMMSKGLGLDNCDRSKPEYFCLSCCKENGCNKDLGMSLKPSSLLLLFALASVTILNVFRKFQPPYVSESEK